MSNQAATVGDPCEAGLRVLHVFGGHTQTWTPCSELDAYMSVL